MAATVPRGLKQHVTELRAASRPTRCGERIRRRQAGVRKTAAALKGIERPERRPVRRKDGGLLPNGILGRRKVASETVASCVRSLREVFRAVGVGHSTRRDARVAWRGASRAALAASHVPRRQLGVALHLSAMTLNKFTRVISSENCSTPQLHSRCASRLTITTAIYAINMEDKFQE